MKKNIDPVTLTITISQDAFDSANKKCKPWTIDQYINHLILHKNGVVDTIYSSVVSWAKDKPPGVEFTLEEVAGDVFWSALTDSEKLEFGRRFEKDHEENGLIKRTNDKGVAVYRVK